MTIFKAITVNKELNKMTINLIVAVGNNNVIGKDGKLPWNIPGILKRFKSLTENKPIVMGRKTFESLGAPLENRLKFVISSGKPINGCVVMKNPKTIFELTFDEIFIIGGQQTYEYFLPFADVIYIMHIFKDYDGDTHFPELDLSEWEEVDYQDGNCLDDDEPKWGFSKYVRIQY